MARREEEEEEDDDDEGSKKVMCRKEGRAQEQKSTSPLSVSRPHDRRLQEGGDEKGQITAEGEKRGIAKGGREGGEPFCSSYSADEEVQKKKEKKMRPRQE